LLCVFGEENNENQKAFTSYRLGVMAVAVPAMFDLAKRANFDAAQAAELVNPIPTRLRRIAAGNAIDRLSG